MIMTVSKMKRLLVIVFQEKNLINSNRKEIFTVGNVDLSNRYKNVTGGTKSLPIKKTTRFWVVFLCLGFGFFLS